MMIVRARDVLAIAEHLFARRSEFAHATGHRINRIAEGGVIFCRAGREILLGDRQGRLGITSGPLIGAGFLMEARTPLTSSAVTASALLPQEPRM
jgi:hypothetical protein